MPTIDELTEATAAADTDELVVSQNGFTRKITRAKIIAGLQRSSPSERVPCSAALRPDRSPDSQDRSKS